MFDTEISSEHNLVDDSTWRRIMSDVEAGKYDSSGAAPPCSSFAACREWDDDGPPPLRGEFEPDIFGFKTNTAEDKEACRIGTCLALRTFEVCKWMYEHDCPFWVETPRRRDGKPSVFKLPQAIDSAKMQGVFIWAFMQCMLEAITMKPTEFLALFFVCSDLPQTCVHPKR